MSAKEMMDKPLKRGSDRLSVMVSFENEIKKRSGQIILLEKAKY